MSQNQSESQQPKTVKLNTENPQTQDVLPQTENTKQETLAPRGPIYSFPLIVSCSELCVLTTERSSNPTNNFGSELRQFGYQNVRALQKPNRKEIKDLWPEAKENLQYLARYLPKQKLIKAIEIFS